MHHLAQFRRGLQKLCTTPHIYAMASEGCAPLGTCWQRPPKVVHHLAYFRRGLQKLYTTWPHLTLGSSNKLRVVSETAYGQLALN